MDSVYKTESHAAILNPEIRVTIDNEEVVIHEITVAQEREIAPLIVELLPELDVAIGDGSDLSRVSDALLKFPDLMLKLFCLCASKTEAWVDNLSVTDWANLRFQTYNANAFFFTTLLVQRRAMKNGK